MANYVFIATSLDGFIATADGGIEWLDDIPNPSGSDYGYGAFMEKIDALVMGRYTFEKVLTFGSWPYEKPVFVLSNRLKQVPEDIAGPVEIINGDVDTIIEQLHARGYRNLYVDGGRVIQSFLNADSIDEMSITLVPVLLGDGIPLFGKTTKTLKFDLVTSETYDNGLVQSHYTRKTE